MYIYLQRKFLPEFKTFTSYCTEAMLLNIPKKKLLE